MKACKTVAAQKFDGDVNMHGHSTKQRVYLVLLNSHWLSCRPTLLTKPRVSSTLSLVTASEPLLVKKIKFLAKCVHVVLAPAQLDFGLVFCCKLFAAIRPKLSADDRYV